MQDANIQQVSSFLLDYAISLMGAGVHTSRVERNVARIAASFGYAFDLTIFQKTILMTITRPDDDMVRRTSVRRIKSLPINFQIISKLSALSWAAYDDHLSLDELRREYDRIMSEPRMSRWVVLLLVSFANAAFCRLFTGDLPAMALVFLATLVGFFIRQEMMNRHMNHLVVFFVVSFIASMIGGLGVTYRIGSTPEIALASSVLFLIPGVPLINSIIDLLEGHVLVATSRFVNAMMLICCIALGLSATLFFLGVNAL